jgi:murein DD-endopeptidase MepM/ murein hydrolase activator NlpD
MFLEPGGGLTRRKYTSVMVNPTDGGDVSTKFGAHNTCDDGAYRDIGTTITKDDYLKDYGVHAAVDISHPDSDDIYASYEGVIVFAGNSSINGGNKIVIQHELDGVNYYSFYFHLQELVPEDLIGKSVGAGDVIAQMGDSGAENNPHLHFEVRTSSGIAFDKNGDFSFPGGAWWANNQAELQKSWVDISRLFGGYDDFLPEDWKTY